MWDAVRKSDASERLARAAQAGFCTAPCLMLVAGLFLLLDLGNAERAWQVLLAPLRSVMSLGAWFVALLTLVSGALAVAGVVLREVPRALQWACCLAGALLALGTMSYTGLLLADMVGIDFWRSPWLVALFVASSLSTGTSVVLLANALLAPPSAELPRSLRRAAAMFSFVEACVLVAFLAVQNGFSETARASCEMLLTGTLSPMFWGGVCVAVLRFGKFNRVAGPGIYVLVPFAEYGAIHIDHRIMTSSFSAEAALTADLVPVDVDAILFWVVWDAEKACLEVENYPKAVLWSAQTAMRDAIGQVNLADLSLRRKQIDRELQEVMSAKCEQWGITVMSVEIRDIMIPRELQDALSKEAQAERERNARIILAEVEKDISEMFVEAADVYDKNAKALKLRAMNLAYEGAKDGKGVLLAPSSLADGFDVGKLLGED